MSNTFFLLKISLSIILIFLISGCFSEKNNYLFESDYEKNRWNKYLKQYENLKYLDEKILWAEDVYNFLLESQKDYYLNNYFSELAYICDDLDFKSYLYFLISNNLWNQNKKELALFYSNKINKKSFSLNYNNQPIGYIIALRIINSDSSYKYKEMSYNLLLEEYKELIDVPYTLYELAMIYKSQLDMDKTISIFKNILEDSPRYKNIESNIDYKLIREEIDYYYMKKNLVSRDLDLLIKQIKNAIIKKDINLLYQFTSKSSFEGTITQKSSQINWSFWQLQINRYWYTNIVFSNSLEPQSNENEAWLKTYNWGFPQLTTWYFYFRRINYPYDNNIDRGWEWAGIFFGDMF